MEHVELSVMLFFHCSLSKQERLSLDHRSFEAWLLFGKLFAEADVKAFSATLSTKLKLVDRRKRTLLAFTRLCSRALVSLKLGKSDILNNKFN